MLAKHLVRLLVTILLLGVMSIIGLVVAAVFLLFSFGNPIPLFCLFCLLIFIMED